MTEAQLRLRDLEDRQSKDRQRAIELSRETDLTDETRQELDTLEVRSADTERQIRAARLAVQDEDAASTVETGTAPDGEQRELLELRSRATVTGYLLAALKGRAPTGAEAELQAAENVDGIPFSLWTPPVENRIGTVETRDVTSAPTTGTGVNLDNLIPAVFAPSVAGFLGIEMPTVPSGAYSTGRINSSATAGTVAKGADVPETAAGWESFVTQAHRIGASLNLALEDIANVGTTSFEPILRQHISLVLSDEFSDAILNDDGSGNSITGIIKRLETIADPTNPGSVADFDAFLAAYADSVEGLWANTMKDVAMLAGVETYRLASKSFRDAGNTDRGETSWTTYAATNTGGMMTNKRMPDPATTIQRAIVCRKGRSMTPAPMRTAVCPTWGSFSVDDIFTGARKGERRFVISMLTGDVILTQPDAYTLREFKVA